jgi:hypothetical protein
MWLSLSCGLRNTSNDMSLIQSATTFSQLPSACTSPRHNLVTIVYIHNLASHSSELTRGNQEAIKQRGTVPDRSISDAQHGISQPRDHIYPRNAELWLTAHRKWFDCYASATCINPGPQVRSAHVVAIIISVAEQPRRNQA